MQDLEVRARADSLGRFSLSFPKGFYRMEAGAKGVPRMRWKQIEVSRDLRNQVLRFDGSYLTGRVMGKDGNELRHVFARATGVGPRGTLTSPDAEYSGQSPYRLLLPRGRYRLVVDGQDGDRGLAPLDTLITASDRDDSLNVVAVGGAVSIRLMTSKDIPRSNADVRWFSSLGESYRVSFTDGQGLAVTYVRPGRYSIVIKPRYESMTPWYFETTLRRDTVLTFELSPVRWNGTARSSTTRAPITAEFSLNQPDGKWWTSEHIQCDSTGKFEALLQPGAMYEVGAYRDGYENNTFTTTLMADSTFDVYLNPRQPVRTPAGSELPANGSPGR